MQLVAEYKMAVIDSFASLMNSLNQLYQTMVIQDADLPIQFNLPMALLHYQHLKPREQAFKLIAQLEYLEEQDPKEILVGPGLVAASKPTINAIVNLNKTKDTFKQAMLALKAEKLSSKDPDFVARVEAILSTRPINTALALQKMGLARVHLKQCYRRLPYFMERPKSVAWTWANTRSIKRISHIEAKAALLKLSPSPSVERQIACLDALDAAEPLAVVQELAPHLRANLVLFSKNDETKRLMIKGPIPIFYLAHKGKIELPSFRGPGPKKSRDNSRPIRQDVKLDPCPFLPAIRVHRYQPNLIECIVES